jgi:hypothetical protein
MGGHCTRSRSSPELQGQRHKTDNEHYNQDGLPEIIAQSFGSGLGGAGAIPKLQQQESSDRDHAKHRKRDQDEATKFCELVFDEPLHIVWFGYPLPKIKANQPMTYKRLSFPPFSDTPRFMRHPGGCWNSVVTS